MSRRQLLVAGAAGAAVLALPRLPARAQGAGDAQPLRFLESLTLFGAAYFGGLTASSGAEALAGGAGNVLNALANHQARQARWFALAQRRFGLNEATLGATPLAPRAVLGARVRTGASMLEDAVSVQEAIVAGFAGQIAEARTPAIVQALSQLHGVQARHLALLQNTGETNPLAALPSPASSAATDNRLARFGFMSTP